MSTGSETPEWSAKRDLNSRPPAPEAGALARLRYSPIETRKGFVILLSPGPGTGIAMTDEDLWNELRREAGIRPPAPSVNTSPAQSPKKPKKGKAEPVPSSWNPEHGPRLRHPWETETFDPGSRELVRRIQDGTPELPGFRLGGSVKRVGTERWVLVQNCFLTWELRTWLAYPLPDCYGDDPIQAINLFQNNWLEQARRIAGLPPVGMAGIG